MSTSEPHKISKPRIPAGYVRTSCRHKNKYPTKVYAHWRDVYKHPCEHCGRRYTTIMGCTQEVGGKRRTADAYYETENSQ